MTEQPLEVVSIAALQKEVADLKRQIIVLTAQLQAAINQRNAFANDSIVVAGEYAVKGQ